VANLVPRIFCESWAATITTIQMICAGVQSNGVQRSGLMSPLFQISVPFQMASMPLRSVHRPFLQAHPTWYAFDQQNIVEMHLVAKQWKQMGYFLIAVKFANQASCFVARIIARHVYRKT